MLVKAEDGITPDEAGDFYKPCPDCPPEPAEFVNCHSGHQAAIAGLNNVIIIEQSARIVELEGKLAAHRWIPVTPKTLPKKKQNCMVIIGSKHFSTSWFGSDHNRKGFDLEPVCTITHWKPITLPLGE